MYLQVAPLPELRELRLSRCSLADFPSGLFALRRLTHLDVSGNSIAAIPEEARAGQLNTKQYKQKMKPNGSPPRCLAPVAEQGK